MLVDDYELSREGILAMLKNPAGKAIEVVGEAGEGEEALALVEKLKPNVALIDCVMPRMMGSEVTRELLQRTKDTFVLGITGYGDGPEALRMLDAGANGFLWKRSPREELHEAVRTVANGGYYLAKDLWKVIIEAYRAVPKTDLSLAEDLSERDREVLVLLCNDKSVKEVAAELNISASTVERVKRKLREKLKAHSMVGLTRQAIKGGVVRP